MKTVAIVTSRFPYPAFSGDRLRVTKIVDALRGKYHIKVLVVENGLLTRDAKVAVEIPAGVTVRCYSIGAIETLVASAGVLVGLPLQAAMHRGPMARRWLRSELAGVDLVIAHLARVYPLVEGLHPLIIAEMTDVISENYRRALAVGTMPFYKRAAFGAEASAMGRLERKIAAASAATVIVNLRDYDRNAPQERIKEIPNGCDTEVQPIGEAAGSAPVLLFIGKCDFPPNWEAIRFIADQILPLLPSQFRLRVVGSGNAAALEELARLPRTEVTGPVASLRDASVGCFCALAPIRYGTGMQNKVLDYAILGLPMLISPVAAQGYSGDFARSLATLEMTPARWAEGITRIWENRVPALEAAAAVRAAAVAEYGWGRSRTEYVVLVERLLGEASEAVRLLESASLAGGKDVDRLEQKRAGTEI